MKGVTFNNGEIVQILTSADQWIVMRIMRIATEKEARDIFKVLAEAGCGPICWKERFAPSNREMFVIEAYPENGKYVNKEFHIGSK